MTAPHAPIPFPDDPYWSELEPHHFRFQVKQGQPRLTVHHNEDGRYLGVYICLTYPVQLTDSVTQRIRGEDRAKLAAWVMAQDEKPF